MKYLDVGELIGVLEHGIATGQWKSGDYVWVDWDREGGNENEVKEVIPFKGGIKIQ
jgi:hypothetical protein